MSSAWWLGTTCMLGLDASSLTPNNLLRTGECVLNLASDAMTANMNTIAKTTGTELVPEKKLKRGYVHCQDKFETAGLTKIKSRIIETPGIQECPVTMEAKLVAAHDLFGNKVYKGGALAIEVEILAVSVHEELKLDGYQNRINAEAWKPMIMLFCDLFALKEKKLAESRLAEIDGVVSDAGTEGGRTCKAHCKWPCRYATPRRRLQT